MEGKTPVNVNVINKRGVFGAPTKSLFFFQHASDCENPVHLGLVNSNESRREMFAKCYYFWRLFRNDILQIDHFSQGC